MQKLFALVLLLPLLLWKSHCNTKVQIKETNLDDGTDWNEIHDLFASGQKVEQIVLYDSVLTLKGLEKLLKEDLSSIKSWNMTSVRVNQETMKLLLEQDFIYTQLETLVLDNCNLQSSDLAALKTQKTKIKKLSLAENFINKEGFQYISRLGMNLTYLNLYHNSLLENESVDKLISWGLTSILELNVGLTSLSATNLLRILNATNTQELTNLTIRYHTFAPEFYQQFAKYSFPKLRSLDLWGMIIDEDAVVYLKNMQLPSLEILNVHQNSLTTESGKELITRSRMPLLHTLDINLNFFDYRFIEHLKDQGFVLKELRCRIFNMDAEALVILAGMNTSLLQNFYFQVTTATPDAIEFFLTKAKLPAIQQLNFMMLTNVGDILKVMCKREWPTLKKLFLPSSGSLKDLNDSIGVIFPSLEELDVAIEGAEQQEVKMVLNLQKWAPKLKKLAFKTDHPENIVSAVINGPLNRTLASNITLKIQTFLQSTQFVSFKIYTNSKPQVLYMSGIRLLAQLMLFGQMQKSGESPMVMAPDKLQPLIEEKIEIVKKNVDFSQIIFFGMEYIKTLDWFIEQNKGCHFPEVKDITLNQVNETDLKKLENCTFPKIKTIYIAVAPNETANGSLFVLPFARYLPYFYLAGKAKTQRIVATFEKNQMEYLQILSLDGHFLKPEELIAILEKGKIKRVRNLGLSQNFLHSGFKFLEKLLLKKILLGSMLIGYRVEDLCAINFEFMEQISLESIEIADQDMVTFTNCVQAKSGFPRLDNIDLRHNKVATKGFQTFFDAHLPLLSDAEFDQNNDPNLFNAIMGSPVGKRLLNFQSTNNYLTSIDPTLDPRSARRLESFVIQSDTLRDTDFEALQKFQFYSLIDTFLILNRIGYCSSLKAITKISALSDTIGIESKQNIETLNSTCLSPEVTPPNPHILPSNIGIMGLWPYNQYRYFADSFLNKNQSLNLVSLPGCYVSSSKIIEMAQFSDMSDLRALDLRLNNLTDEAVHQIFLQDLSLLEQLSLASNPITAKSLEYMNHKTYSSLEILDLSNSYIGDAGIEQLVTNQFPKLQILFLINIQISKAGIEALGKLKAPKLVYLDLSCNDLSADDLVNLDVSQFKILAQILMYPTMAEEDYNRLKAKFNRNRNKNLPQLQIATDIVRLQQEQPEPEEEQPPQNRNWKDKGSKGRNIGNR